MEENKASAVKQTGDDSGYSCTSTRSKNRYLLILVFHYTYLLY